jgi:hypothetical protein
VKIRRGSWNEELFRVLEDFPISRMTTRSMPAAEPLEMLNPRMKGWGIYELYRQRAEAAAERCKPQPVQTKPQPGSMEWFEAQKRKG